MDAQGEPVGAVARSYVDGSGTLGLLKVAIGSFFPRYRLIPVVDAQLTDGRLAVPFTKDTIVESPGASPTRDTLEGELLERVWAYYGPARGSTDVAMAGSAGGHGEDVTAAPAGQAGARDDTAEPAPDTTPRVGVVPLLRPILLYVVVISVLVAFQVFTPGYLLTNGGPGSATRVLPLYIYQTAFSDLRMGDAATASVLMFGMMLVFTAVQLRVLQRPDQ